MSVSKQHFELVAQVLKACKPDFSQAELRQWKFTVKRFVQRFEAVNPRFKKELFIGFTSFLWIPPHRVRGRLISGRNDASSSFPGLTGESSQRSAFHQGRDFVRIRLGYFFDTPFEEVTRCLPLCGSETHCEAGFKT